ncbi:MAG: redoxin domain-containing protein [Armatimonadetes bacterium]|nr:redoxin domain-containing protein [Armatimonadota bacterium]
MQNIPKIRVAAYAVGAIIALAGPIAFAGMMLSGKAQPVNASAPGLSVVSVGSESPDFVLPTHDGRTMHLHDYRGRAVFLVFVPEFGGAETLAQARSLAATAPDFDESGAKVMLIAPDTKANATALQSANKLPFPLLLDEGGALAKQFGVGVGMRRTFVIAPNGQVKSRIDAAILDTANHGKQLLKIGAHCADEVQGARSEGVGKPIGEYSLPSATDPAHPMTTIFGDDRQKATAVLFVSAKCPCSNSYNERIAGFVKKYAGNPNVRLVAVYANADETAAEIAAHAKTHGFTMPVLQDADGLGAKHFGATVTPQAFVLDASHVLRYAGRIDDAREIADVTTHEFESAIEAVASGNDAGIPKATRAFGCAVVR